MRNPNSYGSVYKLPGNRRKPWTARITVAHVGPHYSYKYLGYYKTQAEALMALAEYNRNPYDTSNITLGEAFRRYIEDQSGRVTDNTVKWYEQSYRNMAPIHNRPIAQLKLDALQLFFDTLGKPYPTISQTKRAMVAVFNYAMRYEWVQKNYAQMVDIEKLKSGYTKRKKAVFTGEEIRSLWNIASDNGLAEMLIILLYTGLRVSEMVDLKSEDVDIDKKCFYIRKSKTAAGVRTVPIADCIMPIFQKNVSKPYIANPSDQRVSVAHLQGYALPRLMETLGMNHTFHETRHTFISMMAEAGVDERITKSIVGHAGGSITENVYTHISVQPMLDAVNMLPVYQQQTKSL